MSQNPAFDSSIPVLTEVVLEPLPPPLAGEPEPAATLAEPAAAAVEAAPVPVLTARIDSAAPGAEAPAAERDLDALERRIAERVLAQLQPHLDAVVRNALASAADQIHIGLRQAVEQAVAQQIAAL